MKKIFVTVALSCFIFTGCDSLRLAPGEAQKQNAWLHNRTTMLVAEAAESEDASEELQALTKLSEYQSRAFISYFGLPKEFPQVDTTESLLSQANRQIAETALSESTERPDGWQLADSVLELGIGICALLGGVYGTRAVWFLKQAKAKSKALQEIIRSNEIFKSQNQVYASSFKQAHKTQSSETRQIVAQMKT